MCVCARARVRVSERERETERERGRGQVVLAIKMPALYFLTAEQQAGPAEEDMTPNRRPAQRARPARTNMA